MRDNSILINEIKRLQADNARLVELAERLQLLLLTDDLTSLYGKRYIKEIDNRFTGTISVAMGDIDNFKALNDSKGHAFGDDVLILVANIIKRHIGDEDAAIRFGGDEFIIIFNNVSIEEAAKRTKIIKEYIREEINLCFGIDLTMSFGLSTHKIGVVPFAVSLVTADHRLYIAKQRGKNDVVAVEDKTYRYRSGKGLTMKPRAISSN